MGEFVVITGESGSGKSTLLNVLSGLDSYEEGEMYINGEETSHYSEKDFEDYRRKYVSNIFQEFNLVNSYTVYQNVELALLLCGQKKRKVKKQIIDIIKKVGLYEFRNTKVSKLSGGQKQRVAIARAIIKDTPIIVADEPTGNLDSKSADEVIKILREVARDKLVIIVTHNIEQVEQYATRIIKMHDGHILENREIVHIGKEKKVDEKENKPITNANIWRLGIRNTFNIIPKFLLVLAVFIFIALAIGLEYASFRKEEYETDIAGMNYYFHDLSDKRIVIKKEDSMPFSDEDFAKILEIENVDYIEKNDTMLDSTVELTDNQNIWISGKAKSINEFNLELQKGRMPENENEIIVVGPKWSYYFGTMADQILDKTLFLSTYGNPDETQELKIVGLIATEDNDNNYNDDTTIYFADSILDKIRLKTNESYSKVKTLFEGKYYESQPYMNEFHIVPNDNVKQGEALVSSDLNYMVSNMNCRGKNLVITAENIYYKDELTVKITNTYTKYNFKRLTGIKSFEDNNGSIYINTEDYNSLFNKATYQSSVFVKDAKGIDDTAKLLEEQGIKILKIKDIISNEYIEEIYSFIKLFKTFATAAIIIAMLFIAYFIIRIILKSRNAYFAVLRILGATKKVSKKLLQIELFVNSTVAYILVMVLVILIKLGIIEKGKDIVDYLNYKDYIFIYIVLVLISYVISRKFARKLFKDSAIETYREEV